MALDRDQALRLDKNLSNIALGYKEGIDPICAALAPQMKVPGNGKYPSYAAGAWLYQEDTVLAPGARNVRELMWPVETWNAYVIETHALKGYIDYQDIDNEGIVADMVYSDPKTAAKAITKALNQAWCKKVTALALATAYKATPDPLWDASGATPYDDLITWIKAMKDAIGIGPNGLIMPDRVMWHLGEGARVKYGHAGNFSNYEIVEKMLMRDLNIKNLYVSDAEFKGTTNFESVWGNNIILFRSAKKPNGFEPSYAGTLIPKRKPHVQVYKPYNTLDHTGQFVQTRMRYLVKELDAKAIYMGEAVIS